MKNKYETLNSETHVFVRYSNRKVYDTRNSKYVNGDQLLGLEKGTFKIIKYGSHEDITDKVLFTQAAARIRI